MERRSMTDETPEGMQRVDCPDCGINLGYQSDEVPILWEEWVHTRCPGRLAQRWGLTREQVEELTQTVKIGIANCFPDFPRSDVASAATDDAIRDSRARLTAEYVLEKLASWDVKPRTQ